MIYLNQSTTLQCWLHLQIKILPSICDLIITLYYFNSELWKLKTSKNEKIIFANY